jgi:hypothetical protein
MIILIFGGLSFLMPPLRILILERYRSLGDSLRGLIIEILIPIKSLIEYWRVSSGSKSFLL